MKDKNGKDLKPGDKIVLTGKIESILPDGSMFILPDNTPELRVNIWTHSAALAEEPGEPESKSKGKGGKSPDGN